MITSIIPTSERKNIRARAKLNLMIAKDLSQGFGGKEVDYLKRLNRRLKRRIHLSALQDSQGHRMPGIQI